MKFSFVALLSFSVMVAVDAAADIYDKILDEKRFIVFNSRRLTGECLPICVPEDGSTMDPTDSLTEKPTGAPTNPPTADPTNKPTAAPTAGPTNKPTAAPTAGPTNKPTAAPTAGPTIKPTSAPTAGPTNKPTAVPTKAPTANPTNKPSSAPTGCPVPMTAECVTALDCLNRDDIGILNCPSCVNNVCVSKPAVNGNLNCCKRTPGNDLVITNGCGANNICFGFNDNDQCEVNQHAAYCHPSCPGGNLNAAMTAIDPTKCTNLGNDQGSKGMPFIYPMDYCMTRDIKWKNGMTGQWLENPPLLIGTPPVNPKPATPAVCNPPITPECVFATDCIDHPNHDPMFCPSCVSGMCINKPEVNGNLNCCKRTPGNDLVITNGCGANNLCFGFHEDDQCEVNQHAAYCNPYCPGGNVKIVNGKEVIDTTKCLNLSNDKKALPLIYPLEWCKFRDVKWKKNGDFESFNIPGSSYGLTDAPTTSPTIKPTSAPTKSPTPMPISPTGTQPPTKPPTPSPTVKPSSSPTTSPTPAPGPPGVGGTVAGIPTHPSFRECDTTKWSFKCGVNIFTCGFDPYYGPITTRPADMCSSQPFTGFIREIDNDVGYESPNIGLCQEMITKLMTRPSGGTEIKCGEVCTPQGNGGNMKCVSNAISNWVCYPPGATKSQLKKVDWSNGAVETNCA
ncbi:peptidoglycan-binding domain protein [Nitzschia inconspicua]|uniref:Peptidoglycan-binding domain protein n=1 Tax=Nitzschia inconspicua TaxID=303405 RepID=A0A9K3K9U6_9STRA|nr:peptidoglycan-binding domain protein [Nitzschia inconspicua]KAG7365626.1 peptidoglycan-binding domain protein [Nitzschia inconspicua]